MQHLNSCSNVSSIRAESRCLKMPQLVPSAGFTPPCDYSNFAETFDLSLLPGGDYPLSPQYNLLYTQSPPPAVVPDEKPKIYTTYYPNSNNEIQKKNDIDLGPDFQKLLPESAQSNLYPPSPNNGIYLEVPSSTNYHANSPIGALSPYSPQQQGLLSPSEQYSIYQEAQNFYPNSPDVSLYNSPNSYARSPREDFVQTQFIKKENSYQNSPIHNSYTPYHVKEENYLPSSPEFSNQSPVHTSNYPQIENTDVFELLKSTLLEKQVKQESTVDFSNLLEEFTTNNNTITQNNNYKNPRQQPATQQQSSPQDHQLLREVLRDTSFQKKYNIKPIDFGFMTSHIKMEEPDEGVQKELMKEQLARESIEPALKLAIEARIDEMRKDAESTCAALSISPDTSKWTSANVWSWLQWTCRELELPSLVPEQWDITGTALLSMTEEDFNKRAPQVGSMIYAQLEIWKAACMDEDRSMQWMPETTSSNASSGGDMSDEDEEESSTAPVESKPTTSRSTGGSHIHLWQFLKELLASPQIHGSCIRWLDRSSGVFKIEDSVKVARLWGKRKNRPAMNYDKLSRSIRQYYKKGIMKKTERSQRLVYQFCHPYCL